MGLSNLFGLMGPQAISLGANPARFQDSAIANPEVLDPIADVRLNNQFDQSFPQGGISSPQHKGMFGISGTGRDILGVLGDAFLLNSGLKPIYHPQRQSEKIGDAWANIGTDPAALQQIASVDADLARKITDDLATAEYRKAVAQNAADKEANAERGRHQTILSSILAQVGDNEAAYPAARDLYRRYAQRYGIDSEIPDAYDRNVIEQGIALGMTPDQIIDNRETGRSHLENERIARGRFNVARQNATTAVGRLTVAQKEQAAREADRTRRTDYYVSGAGNRGGRRSPMSQFEEGKTYQIGNKSYTIRNGKAVLVP